MRPSSQRSTGSAVRDGRRPRRPGCHVQWPVQPFLLPPDMREWLPADHAVWLAIGVVSDHLDTSAVHALRSTGGAGAAGYDPDILVTLLVWAYAAGVTSLRRIEADCRTDVAFRVICAGGIPDHVTIARFRAGFPGLGGCG